MANKDRLRLWVDALRSGAYTQGYRALCDNGKYCCLGVACEVAISNGVAVNISHSNDGTIEYDNESSVMPPSVFEWFDVNENPSLPFVGDSLWPAADMNDNGKTFEEIANAIEEKYELRTE